MKLVRCVRTAAAATLVLAQAGCAVTLTPPSDLREPTTVHLLDHGRTPSLVLPTADGGMVRYAYGDWTWYALGKTGALEGMAALLWPTQGALGRCELSGPPTIEQVRWLVPVGIEHAHSMTVERERVDALRQRLDALHQQRAAELVLRPSAGLSFVPHPQRYSLLHNSNSMLAGWLEELGIDVRGIAIDSNWRVRNR